MGVVVVRYRLTMIEAFFFGEKHFERRCFKLRIPP